MTTISRDAARILALEAQGLRHADCTDALSSRRRVIRVLRQLGVLQIDALSTVARNHELVIWSRAGNFNTADIFGLLDEPPRAFEQRAHVASLLPIEDYAMFRAIVGRLGRDSAARKLRKLGAAGPSAVRAVLRRVRRYGEVMASDFSDIPQGDGAWWNWKPTKVALEILFRQGRLAVKRRDGFRRVYSLAEDHYHSTSRVYTYEEAVEHFSRRAVRSLGVATIEHIADYYRLPRPDVVRAVAHLEHEGQLRKIEVSNVWPVAFVSSRLSRRTIADAARGTSTRTTVLAPLDNLLWHRQRVEDLFDFRFRFTVYLPKESRAEYYTLPILHRGHLIGKIEPKLERDAARMLLRSVNVDVSLETIEIQEIAATLAEFARFHGAGTVKLLRVVPERLRPVLVRELRRLITVTAT